MVKTSSTMLPLGTKPPHFELTNAVDGRSLTLDDFGAATALLVMFICNHCPYVQHVRSELGRLARDYMSAGLAIAAVNSNSKETHPEDGPSQMRELALTEGWDFPYLFDESQAVAKSFRAACTPDFFLFDADRRLAYRGQLDESRPGNLVPVTGQDLRQAIEAVLMGEPPLEKQVPSIGCNIKWRPGNEPEYWGA
ncbi:MAG: thioredoxin family protein [Gemmatimonadota bacterium]|nr:MAG: thioredoxin family protein [Gemmatimonadota bacterium]